MGGGQFLGQGLQRGLASGGQDQIPTLVRIGPGQGRAYAGRGAGDQNRAPHLDVTPRRDRRRGA